MSHIFRSEWSRYAVLIWLIFAGHIGFIWFATVNNIYQLWSGSITTFLTAIGSMMIGLAFGAWQFWRHTNVASWTYLFHRPLSPGKILAGLLLSGLAVITVAMALPVFMTLVVFDLFSTKVVDLRHYGFPLFQIAAGFSFYLIGALTMLYPNKLVLLLLGTVVFSLHLGIQTTPIALLSTQVALIIPLIYLVYWAFKGDLSTAWRKPVPLLLGAVLASYTLMFVPAVLMVPFYHIPLYLVDQHPNLQPPTESFRHYFFKTPEAQQKTYFLKRIEGLADNRRADLISRADTGDYFTIPHTFFEVRVGMRHSSMNHDPRSIRELGGGAQLVMSHDHLLLKIVRFFPNPDEKVWIGRRGFLASPDDATSEDRFLEPLWLYGPVHSSKRVYDIDFDKQTVTQIFQAQDDERLIGATAKNGGYRTMTTNKRTYFFDQDSDLSSELTPLFSVDHPLLNSKLDYIRAVTMGDDLMLTYVGNHDYWPGNTDTYSMLRRADGSIEPLGRYTFTTTTHPDFYYHSGFAVSPLLYELDRLFWHMVAPGQKKGGEILPAHEMPTSMLIFALIMAPIAALLSYRLAQNAGISRQSALGFAAVGLLVGIVFPLGLLIFKKLRLPRLRPRHKKDTPAYAP